MSMHVKLYWRITSPHSICYKDDHWNVEDGCNGKASTNGTWLFVDEFFQLRDGMVFKAGQVLFNVVLKAPQRS